MLGEDASVADENAPVFTTPELRLTGNAERDNAVREQFAYRQVRIDIGNTESRLSGLTVPSSQTDALTGPSFSRGRRDRASSWPSAS